MNFEQKWNEWLHREMENAEGKRLERLRSNLFGEKNMFKKVLWPIFQSTDPFSLEYEVKSISGTSIFIDVFYHPLRIAFECEGYVPHAERVTRDRFAFEKERIRSFSLYGFVFFPFSWDELNQKPEECRRAVYELLGRVSASSERAMSELNVYEREVLRFALRLPGPFRLRDVCHCLKKDPDTCRKVFRGLMGKELVRPVGKGRKKIRLYELDRRASEYLY